MLTILFVLGVILSVILGFFAVLLVLPVIPGLIDLFVNRPNLNRPEDDDTKANELDYRRSESGFFTYLQPGRVKIIERGGKFIKAIMAYPGHMFLGERSDNALRPNDDEYWEIRETRTSAHFGDRDSHPIPFPRLTVYWFFYFPVSILWWLWKRWTYTITGAVFTGIYPFQRVRVYPMERFVQITSDGTDSLKPGTIKLVRKKDYSDHYRVAHFQFPVLVPDANTSDKLAVKVQTNTIAAVFNPWLTAYNTDDDWSSRFLASISDAVTNHVRTRELSDVLSSSEADKRELSRAIAQVGMRARPAVGQQPAVEAGSATDFGILIPEKTPPQVLDISAVDPAHESALADVAIAKVNRDAAVIRAEGLAAPTREQGKAMREYPESTNIPAIEGTVRAAEAAGKNGIVILTSPQGSVNAMDAANFQQLRNLNQQGQTPAGGAQP